MKKISRSKKGVIVQVMIFIILSLVLIFIFAIIAPFGTLMTTSAYVAGETMMNQSYVKAGEILDTNVRTELTGLIEDSTTMTTTNIQVTTGMYKYGWLFFIIILGLAIFLYTRKSTEIGLGGFV